MTKKKNVRPFFAVKGEFTDSLDVLCHESIMFLQAVEIAIELGAVVSNPAGEKLKERVKAFRHALTRDEPDED